MRGSFFDAGTASLETKLLKMELLAQNFHEALNLVPLFEHLQREINRSALSREERRDLLARLGALAREVTRKQLIVLEAGGQRHDYTVIFSDSLVAGTRPEQLEDVELTLDGVKRRFRVTVTSADLERSELAVNLEVETPPQAGVSGASSSRHAVEFPLGFFSTPMIDNEFTRSWLDGSAQQHKDAPDLSNALPVQTLESEDIANAVHWLVSDAARYVTGVALPVDAGFVNKR